MKKIKKIILFIITVCIGILFIFSLYSFINSKILKNKITTIGGYSVLEIASSSMEPILKKGDLIIINTKDKKVEKNDIVTFYDKDETLVTHRIIDIDKQKMRTKGDANNTDDGQTSINNIIGKHVLTIHHVGKIIDVLKSPMVTIIMFIVGGFLCMMISMNDNEKIKYDEKEYQEFQAYLIEKNKEEKLGKKKSR